MHWEGRRAAFWTRPLGVRVQKGQKVQRVQRVVVGACGASFDKTLKPPCRAGKTGKPGLWPDGNAPLSPPAAVLPPEGEVCSTFTLPAVRVILSASEESRYTPHLRQMVINTSRRRKAASGVSPLSGFAGLLYGKASHEIFSRLMAPYKFRSLTTPSGWQNKTAEKQSPHKHCKAYHR